MTASNRLHEERLEAEREHFNRIALQHAAESLRMPASNLDRYRRPSASTPYALEYAFHLAGDLRNRVVVEIGSGDGLNTTILAGLGAKVTAIDISDESLRLAKRRAEANGVDHAIQFIQADAGRIDLPDAYADVLFVIAILHHLDIPAAVGEIHRLLKPGGRAVFVEPMVGHPIWETVKRALPKPPDVTDDERPLTLQQVQWITHTVGRPGPARHFGFTSRLTQRLNFRSARVVHGVHVADSWLLQQIPFLKRFASPLVWAADKPGGMALAG